MIERFKRTTYKFEKKMGVFLNETYFKNKVRRGEAETGEARYCEDRKKPKKRQKWSPEIEEEDDESFKEINAEIANIVEELMHEHQAE